MAERRPPLPPRRGNRTSWYGQEGWDPTSWYGDESVLNDDQKEVIRRRKEELERLRKIEDKPNDTTKSL